MQSMRWILLFAVVPWAFDGHVRAQQWIQVGSPIGGGITKIAVHPANGYLFATTSSYNWPSVPGGVHRSTDGGTTWQRQYNPAYTARTLEIAADGWVYASIWFFPSNEGIFASPNGTLWVGPIFQVGSSDNIFCIKSHPTNGQILFAGTRNGIARTTNQGSNWIFVNNGIPANSWVRALAIDSAGIIAAGTTNGLFVSTNNGGSWTPATGIDDTVTALLFDDSSSTSVAAGTGGRLISGSEGPAGIYASFRSAQYLTATLVALFGSGHPAEIAWVKLLSLNYQMHGVAVFAPLPTGGGISFSSDGGITFTPNNQGLPPNPRTSAVVGYSVGATYHWFAGLNEDTAGGAKVFKMSIVVGVNEGAPALPSTFALSQNYPNPFNPSTTIKYQLSTQGRAVLKVYDMIGREVATLVNEVKAPGSYEATWNASSVASGVYLYKLNAGAFTEAKKLILLR